MSSNQEVLEKVLRQALSGRGAHVETGPALEGLDWELAGSRPHGVAHSVFQLLNHMIYWQDFSLRWLDGNKPATPEHASESWPGDSSPKDAEEWEEALRQCRRGLDELKGWVEKREFFFDAGHKATVEILQLICSHNSYHFGQVVLVRQLLCAWPPPGGGATW